MELIAAGGAPTERERAVAQLMEVASERAASAGSRVAGAYGALREFQCVLASAREGIRGEEDAQFEAAEDKYERKDYGDWLDEQEEYHKLRGEARYQAEREKLIGALARWWQTVLHASLGVGVAATPAQSAAAGRFSTSEILHRLEQLEQLHEWLARNIQESLALEVTFLELFA